MNKRFVLTLLLVATAGAFSNVLAQTVWRCGADGRSFSDRPCADGQPLQRAELADTRSAAQVQAAAPGSPLPAEPDEAGLDRLCAEIVDAVFT
ncbi:MAG TPA: hypothetical protein PK420_12840, partial [Rubrivivax sp.]|nr:hypothetical protein [Rubrivivax sp.]